MIAHWIVIVLLFWAGSSAGLKCYECRCSKENVYDCNCDTTVTAPEGTHCTIVEDLHSDDPFIEMATSLLDSSSTLIRDPYYILLDESIGYNVTGDKWSSQPKRVVFGCDWDLCNKYSFVESLPRTFQLEIASTWLTENIYGTGSINECPTCSELCGNDTNPIDFGSCSLQTCENSTTCSIYYLWHDLTTSSGCYKSGCAPQFIPDEFTEEDDSKYEVNIQAIVYLAQDRSQFDIWQITILCATTNCASSTFFNEVKSKINGDTSDLSAFPLLRPTTTPSPSTTPPKTSLRCYNCSCVGPICPCSTYEISEAANTFCTISREYYGQTIFIDYAHIDPSSTHIRINEFPFVLVKDSITYSESTGRWITLPELVVYGCKGDLCNKPELLSYLPSSFQMRLPESWLNESILGTGQPVRDCHQCPDEPVCSANNFIDGDLCPIQSCNTTCLVSDVLNDVTTGAQCYQSFCAPTDFEGYVIETHRVDIEGVLYRSRPTEPDIWEIDVYCRADNCSRPELFSELREKLTIQTGDLSQLFNLSDSQLPKLRCYECYCTNDTSCQCDTIIEVDASTHQCIIVRDYEDNPNIMFSNERYDPVESQYREFPYVRLKEFIYYDEANLKWLTESLSIRYGCNWDYCNKRSLLSVLPTSFQMNLPDVWLNTNLIGDNNPIHQCRNCSDSATCDLSNNVDLTDCPLESCDAICSVSFQYNHSPENNKCFQSICIPEDSDYGPVDKYLVEVDGIIYRSNPKRVELLEAYIHCRTDNCSRPEIFDEIKQKLTIVEGNLTALLNETSISEANLLRCYDCYCEDDPICACNKTVALPAGDTYCVLIREYDGQDFWIFSEHIDRNSTRVFIREFPYMLVEETILYNDATSQWITRPTLVLYGCNTDLCNDHRLVPRLPVSFQMRLSDDWLNKNVLGNGSTIRDCHECPDNPQCGTEEFLDTSRCPVKQCNTTCLVSDTFDDPSVNEQCYQSFCAPPDNEIFTIDPHRLEIEGIIYGNRPNAQVDLWEIDIFCRADDCSRPEIFKELRSNLTVETGDLSAFFNITTFATTVAPPVQKPLSCYQCACYDVADCSCDTVEVSDATSTYCTIVRMNDPDSDFLIELQHVDRNSTRVNIRKFPYILAEESIIYNETTQIWTTRTNLIVYGCNTHLCNHPKYVPLLPGSFEMRLSDDWLNKNVLGNGSTIRDCHECPNTPQCGSETFLDTSRCPIRSCNTTCLVSDIYNDPSLGEYCYQSYCAPPNTPQFTIDPHRVEIEGLIYEEEKDKFELWEIDIYCQADDCSRPEIFNELRGNLTVDKTNLSLIFDNSSKPVIEPQLICFDCNCDNQSPCECETYTVRDAKNSYCIIYRANFGSYNSINVGHIGRNTTRVYIREFPFLLVEESIIYNNVTTNWDTKNNVVLYGCNWDYCNHPCYIPFLPDSFEMLLPNQWLNNNIKGSGQPVSDCHVCPLGPECTTTDIFDGNTCPIESCDTTCILSEAYKNPNITDFCYESYCAPQDSEFFKIDTARVDMEGILYLTPIGRDVELWEVDVFCRAPNCSRPELFNDVSTIRYSVISNRISYLILDPSIVYRSTWRY
uniref:ArkA_3 n=1 Tax=Philodina roseola TaxID=96448 RepID=B2L3M4_PHIRO|nr:ArkA_3 [Philodina roseola]